MTFLHYLLDDDETDVSGQDVMKVTAATADALVDDTEAVVFVWDFDELKDYLLQEREVRNALSAYMNFDLRAKLASLNTTTAAASSSSKLQQARRITELANISMNCDENE